MTEGLYEGMFLFDSSKFASDPEGVANRAIGILKKAGANIVAQRAWQDGKLAYEIQGRRKGTHYLVYFKMDGQKLTDVNRACKLSDVVLRHMVIRHPESLFNMMVDAISGSEGAEIGGEAVPAGEGRDMPADDNADDDADIAAGDGDSPPKPVEQQPVPAGAS